MTLANPLRGAYRTTLAALIVVAALSMGLGPQAGAAAGDGIWADWTLGGASTAYTGSVDLPGARFPSATLTSDARANSTVVSGASAWLGAGTPPGAIFGSSRNEEYVNFRPTTSEAPSTTTYTFASPTPASGWGFVLGDVDADSVTISATDASGAPVSTAGLGFAGEFNYCDTSPRPSTCSGESAPYDLPTWAPATNGGTLMGGGSDSKGAAGWFRPTVALSSLTLVFSRQVGFPTYQTWFATTDFRVTGAVLIDGSTPSEGTTVSLRDPSGIVGTTTTAADGTYSFDGLLDGVTYSTAVTAPAGYATVGAAAREFTVSGADPAGMDFELTETHGVSGTVTTTSGDAVPGAEVTVTDADGLTVCTTTADPGGSWLCSLPNGSYTATGTSATATGEASFDVTGADVAGVSIVLDTPISDSNPSTPTTEPGATTPTVPGVTGPTGTTGTTPEGADTPMPLSVTG